MGSDCIANNIPKQQSKPSLSKLELERLKMEGDIVVVPRDTGQSPTVDHAAQRSEHVRDQFFWRLVLPGVHVFDRDRSLLPLDRRSETL